LIVSHPVLLSTLVPNSHPHANHYLMLLFTTVSPVLSNTSPSPARTILCCPTSLYFYAHDPHLPHYNRVKRILRYLKGTLDHGLHINSTSPTYLTSYSDADWVGCPDTRPSTYGYCVFLGNNLISWSSKTIVYRLSQRKLSIVQWLMRLLKLCSCANY
jgi:hypothetical protein